MTFEPQLQADRDQDDVPASLLDLALGQGRADDLEQLRARLGRDPLAAVEFAETRQLLERLRGLAVAPSERLAARLAATVRIASRREALRRTEPGSWRQLIGGAVAAAALFALLVWIDPLGLQCILPSAREQRGAAVARTVVTTVGATTTEPMSALIDRVILASQQLEPSSRLQLAWDRYQGSSAPGTAPVDRLSQWLSPRNALAVLQIDRELRSTADARRRALHDRGQLDQVEDRVQDLATEVGQRLRSPARLDVDETALAIRAVLAAGDADPAVLARGGERLLALLPDLEDGGLATALNALGELAAATGEFAPQVLLHGNRFVREVLDPTNWSRRRPRMLSTATTAAVADAGRFLQIAPAFGIDSEEALVVRLLLAAPLQERRDPQRETPDVPTALVFAFADLLTPEERGELETRLRVWRPAALLPDFRLLHELAASRAPDRVGYARFQLDLRSIGATATPVELRDRAALCLCLSTAFAARATHRPPAQG